MQPIKDNDLLCCSKYFKQKHITKLIEALDDSSLNLVEVEQKYSDIHMKVYRVLQKWIQAHPNTSHNDLKVKFELLGFSKAAKK